MNGISRSGAAAVLLVVSAMATGCHRAAAQDRDDETTRVTVGVGVSADYVRTLDGLISPRPHDGAGITQNGVFVSIEDPESYHEIDFWLGKLDVTSGSFPFRRGTTTVQSPDSETEILDAAYTYMARLTGNVWMGLSLAANAIHTQYELGAGAAEGFLYAASLRLALGGTRDLSEQASLRFGLRVPLVGWATRPTYSTVDEARFQSGSDVWHRLEQGHVFSPLSLQGVSGRASLLQALGEHVGVRAAIRFDYTRHHDQAVFESFRAGLDLGIVIRWPGAAR